MPVSRWLCIKRSRVALFVIAALVTTPAFTAANEANAQPAITPVSADDFRDRLTAATTQSDSIILVNFWATWCGPCLEEIPVFMRLEDEFGAQGFRLIAVSLDDAESMNDQVLPFMQKWFPDFNSLISTEYDMDDMVSVVDQGWNEVLPTSYLLARDGSVAERLQGSYTHEQFAAKIAALLQD